MAYIPPFLLFVDYRSIEIQATGRPGTSNSGYMTTMVSKICSDAIHLYLLFWSQNNNNNNNYNCVDAEKQKHFLIKYSAYLTGDY